MDTFPDGLRSLRKSIGLSQWLAAELFDVSPRLVGFWEQGLRAPNVENLWLASYSKNKHVREFARAEVQKRLPGVRFGRRT